MIRCSQRSRDWRRRSLPLGVAALAGFLVAIWLRRQAGTFSPEAFAWPMAASLLCAPVVYPWYLLWLLPFVRSASSVPIIIWTVSIIPTYYVWHLRTLGRPWLASGMDHGSGIWICGAGCRDSRAPAVATTGGTAAVRGTTFDGVDGAFAKCREPNPRCIIRGNRCESVGRSKSTVPTRESCIPKLAPSSNTASVQFTEE